MGLRPTALPRCRRLGLPGAQRLPAPLRSALAHSVSLECAAPGKDSISMIKPRLEVFVASWGGGGGCCEQPWGLSQYLQYFFLTPGGGCTSPWYIILYTFGTSEIFIIRRRRDSAACWTGAVELGAGRERGVCRSCNGTLGRCLAVTQKLRQRGNPAALHCPGVGVALSPAWPNRHWPEALEEFSLRGE